MVSVDPNVAAVQTLLTGLGRAMYVGRAPASAVQGLATGGPGYVVLEPSQGLASTTSFEGSSDQRFCRFVTRYFGAGWESVDELRTLTKTALLDVRPTVTGRVAERISHESEFPYDRDEDLPNTVMWSGDSWTYANWPNA